MKMHVKLVMRRLTEKHAKAFEARIKSEAKKIHDKYVEVPFTTEFALMFLPSESLYAECLRRPGMIEDLQNNYRVTVAGPTVLSALLNSLQMGLERWRFKAKRRSLDGFRTS